MMMMAAGSSNFLVKVSHEDSSWEPMAFSQAPDSIQTLHLSAYLFTRARLLLTAREGVCLYSSAGLCLCAQCVFSVYSGCVSVWAISEPGMYQDTANPDDQHRDPVLHVQQAQGVFAQSSVNSGVEMIGPVTSGSG